MLTADAEGKTISLPPENGAAIWVVLDLVPHKRGSMEDQLVALAGRLATLGAHARFVFAAAPPAWLATALASSGAIVHTLEFRRAGAATLGFAALLRQARPDLVHFHFVRAYSPLVAMARAAGARVVLHDHMHLGSASGRLWSGLKRARAAALNRLVDLRIAVSRFVADSVRAAEYVAADRLIVVENGIDVARFAAADGGALRRQLAAGERPVIACVARLVPDKGVGVLVRALPRVGRDALLVVAGEGPDAERLRAEAAALHLTDHVRFLGRRDDVERVLAAADVVALPSVGDEAFGLAAVEAMAAGKPIVASAAGALPEVVEHGRSGLVVPRGDEAAFAGAIGRLLVDRELAARLGAAGQARARTTFALSRWLDRIVGGYATLLPSSAPTARAA
jgi:glycosyltransferase involved in cell wall biosynthesis